MSGAGDRFRVARVLPVPAGSYLCDGAGWPREYDSAAAAVRALTDAGEDLAAWRVWWQPAGAIGWRVACLACDAGDVFAGR